MKMSQFMQNLARRHCVGAAIVLLVMGMGTAGASPRVEVKRGNRAAQDSLSDAALYHYKKALEERADTSLVMYNLGNLMYQQGDFENAEKTYAGALDPEAPKSQLQSALYNLGNTLYQEQKYDQAVEAYVEALKRNPDDDDARYNLELARRMLQQQQQQQEQNNDENKEQKEQQDQQQQQQPDSNQQQEQQDQQQQQQPQEQEHQEQQQQQMADQPMSKEQAERLLNALLNSEQDVLKDVKKAKAVSRKKREKDW